MFLELREKFLEWTGLGPREVGPIMREDDKNNENNENDGNEEDENDALNDGEIDGSLIAGEITFSITENGGIYIQCQWPHPTEQNNEQFGRFLFLLNSGNVTEHIINYLHSSANTNPNASRPIQQIFESWHTSNNLYNQTPIIRPLALFNRPSMGEQE